MICVNCLLQIDDDSSFCDQCGSEILICPECGQSSSGKICPVDGVELIRNETKSGFSKNKFFNTQRRSKKPSIKKTLLHMINKTLDLEFEVENDEIIGRKEGSFASQLVSYKQISSKHLSFTFKNQTGWTITDLNSTNGTKLNGEELMPMKPYKLNSNDLLIIANLEFYISMK